MKKLPKQCYGGLLGQYWDFFLTKVYDKIFGARKELSYSVISDATIVNVKRNYAKDVSVTYMRLPAKTLQLISLKLINTGNVTIRKTDYDMPLSFVDDKPEKDDKVTEFFRLIFPDNTPISKRAQAFYNEQVGIKNLMFNRGESIMVDIINVDTLDSKVKLNLQGRLVGGKIKEMSHPMPFKARLLLLFIGGLIGIIITLCFVLIALLFNWPISVGNILFISGRIALAFFLMPRSFFIKKTWCPPSDIFTISPYTAGLQNKNSNTQRTLCVPIRI